MITTCGMSEQKGAFDEIPSSQIAREGESKVRKHYPAKPFSSGGQEHGGKLPHEEIGDMGLDGGR